MKVLPVVATVLVLLVSFPSAGTEKAQLVNLDTDPQWKVRQIAAILAGDLFEAFGDELKQYDTDLKRKTFLKISGRRTFFGPAWQRRRKNS